MSEMIRASEGLVDPYVVSQGRWEYPTTEVRQRGSREEVDQAEAADRWRDFRRAGLVVKGEHNSETIIVTFPTGETQETSVMGTVPLNDGRDTLVIPHDPSVIIGVSGEKSRRLRAAGGI